MNYPPLHKETQSKSHSQSQVLVSRVVNSILTQLKPFPRGCIYGMEMIPGVSQTACTFTLLEPTRTMAPTSTKERVKPWRAPAKTADVLLKGLLGSRLMVGTTFPELKDPLHQSFKLSQQTARNG